MRIGDVARRTGVSVATVRLYEAEGLLGARPRPGGARGHRRFDETTVEAVRLIRNAQALGLTLAEVRVLLGPHGEAGPDAEAMLALLDTAIPRLHHHQAWLTRAGTALRPFARYTLDERGAAGLAEDVVERLRDLGDPYPVPRPLSLEDRIELAALRLLLELQGPDPPPGTDAADDEGA